MSYNDDSYDSARRDNYNADSFRQSGPGGGRLGAASGGRGMADDFDAGRRPYGDSYGDDRRDDNNNNNYGGEGGNERRDYGDNPGGATDQRLYGGGGGDGGDNYYDSTQRFDDSSSRPPRKDGEGGGYGDSSGTPYGGAPGYSGGTNDDDDDEEFSAARRHAEQHAGDAGDGGLFGSALGLLKGRKGEIANEDIDEEDAVAQHRNFYGDAGAGGHASSGNMGAAAAMQALKMFTGGGGGHSGGGGGMQGQFIGVAMGQAAKLFDQQSAQGKVQGGATKEDAVGQAAKMALKMYMKSEMGGGGGGGHGAGMGGGGLGAASAGGGGGGGLQGLMGLASKFMR